MVEKIREEFMYMDAVNYISDVLQKTKGKELKVAFLGGSLSKGERVKRELCFVSLFEQKLKRGLVMGEKFRFFAMDSPGQCLRMVYIRFRN